MIASSFYDACMKLEEIARCLAALGNETRLSIYRVLVRAGDKGSSVTGIQERLGIPASTLSHHLHKLILVGLVRQERRGTTLVCRADYQVMEQTLYFFARECCADDADSACIPANSYQKEKTK